MKVMSELESISLTQMIEKINELIDSGNGDAGRLYHILEFLKNKKPLYRSDQIYLESKLNTSFEIDETTEDENDYLPQIKKLIETGQGDPGRLQHISDMISDNKQLYNSDIQYLQSKLSPNLNVAKIVISHAAPKPENHTSTKIKLETKSKTVSVDPPKTTKKIVTRGSMPKGWTSQNVSNETNEIYEKIENENEKIHEQEKISNELNSNRLKLSELITHRKEYEQKVTQEKNSLESQIKNERLNIETQTKLSRDILLQKEELEKVKKARTHVIKKINSEKSKISTDLLHQKKQLVSAQLEQEEIEKQIEHEQILLAKMTEEQKSQLTNQSKIAAEIKDKKAE